MSGQHRREDRDRPEAAADLRPGSVGFGVLFVCTGNVVRSPMAERLLQARLPSGTGPGVSVSSAGTDAFVGRPMESLAGLVLRELGGNPNGHTARQLRPAGARRASLILTATTSQRDAIVRDDRSVLRRTFAIREFARLGREVLSSGVDPSGADLGGRVRQIAERRASAPPPGSSVDEIADSLGAPFEVMRFRGLQISDAVDGVLYALGLGPVPDVSGRRRRPVTLE